MNERNRQIYLTALGVETYMPRWNLPFSLASGACVLPVPLSINTETKCVPELESVTECLQQAPLFAPKLLQSENNINHLLIDMLEAGKVNAAPKKINDNLTKESVKNTQNAELTIARFSLSVWRPVENLMIIDSRNTMLALPTELLLNNVLRFLLPDKIRTLKEEVLRWPMIENAVTKPTIAEARAELQTWFSVQCEVQPLKYLWLLGANSAKYFLPLSRERDIDLWCSAPLNDLPLTALILPSLNELLQRPLQKKQLHSAIKRYHS
jgi:hypothetical protein